MRTERVSDDRTFMAHFATETIKSRQFSEINSQDVILIDVDSGSGDQSLNAINRSDSLLSVTGSRT